MKLTRIGLPVLLMLAGSGVVFGATTTFSVTATVAAACSFQSPAAENIPFGTFTGTAISVNTSDITIKCNKNTAYTVGLDNGSNFSGGSRNIKDASSDLLPYIINKPVLSAGTYTCTGASTLWGSAGANLLSGTALNASNITLPMCATLSAATDPAAGIYSDTVTATVLP